jgi:serine/threonine-protein kinase
MRRRKDADGSAELETSVREPPKTRTSSLEPLPTLGQAPEAEPRSSAPPAERSRRVPPTNYGPPPKGIEVESAAPAIELAERYRHLADIGLGGMGRVVLCEDERLGRVVAVKTLIDDRSEKQRARFLEEARSTAQLEHPSIVPVYDLDPSARTPYFSMRFVEGRSLAHVLAQLRAREPEVEREFGRAELVLVFLKVCDAVSYAHSRGVLHRDLKPENVMIGKFGEVFVMDWGLARVGDADPEEGPRVSSIRDSGSGVKLTQAGAILGTPGYMSPEQARGDRDAVDERSDVFALGVMLYEMLSLEAVFSGDSTLQLLTSTIVCEIVPPRMRAPSRAIGSSLDEIVMRALERDPAKRWPSVRAFRDAVASDLEASEEARRRRERARSLLETAWSEIERYVRTRAQHEEERAALERCKREIDPLDTRLDVRRELWRREAQAEELRAEAERAYWNAYGTLVSAVQEDGDLAEARHALVDLLLDRSKELAAVGQRDAAADFVSIARQHDRVRVEAAVDAPATVTLATVPPGARAVVSRFHAEGPLLVERAIEEASAPVKLSLPPGSYVVDLTHAGQRTRVPLVVGPNEERTVEVRLPKRGSILDGFVYVPPGRYAVGGDPVAPGSGPRRVAEIGGFAIAMHLVTMEEYAEFLNHLAERDPALARARAPRIRDVPYWSPDANGRYTTPWRDSDGDEYHSRTAVRMVSARDADAFARFRAERLGRPLRLPTSDEWEAAARGMDERIFPWGNGFEPSLAWMRESCPRTATMAVGTRPLDRSIFGVMDLAGLVREYTSTRSSREHDLRDVRGGAWAASSALCRAARVAPEPEDAPYPTIGLRLAHDVAFEE